MSITILAPVSCTDWNEGRSERTKVKPLDYSTLPQMREFWLLGLITGLNANHPAKVDLLSSVNSTLVFDWMDRYCKKNPASDVFAGAESLLSKIERESKR
ncbi:hypothetical protein [Rhodoferax sp. U11-2br]|uniref:hypothetical protein n=1 Tax=Rhodoferax sp. U11-2br TaxID=2838878 RepID=UPI001BEB1DB2|nr:hypothetical protein [Rhodoferax sp. U11-2br]MBT3068899.1 hypothetical protein [Rhodoferax sp. U11-2br]